jgi:hypothetical protein
MQVAGDALRDLFAKLPWKTSAATQLEVVNARVRPVPRD